MVNRCLLQQQNKSRHHQKRHLFPISFVSLNNPNSYTSQWPEKWGDLRHMTISIADLENYFNLIILKLKASGINSIEIKGDYYLNISAEQWDTFDKEVSPSIGSLADDINSLNKNVRDEFFTYVDFDRVSSVLKAISQELNPVNPT